MSASDRIKKYRNSPKGKATRERWLARQDKAKVRESARARTARYRRRSKGIQTERAWRQSQQGKKARNEAQRRYYSRGGRAAVDRYQQTPRGQAALHRTYAKRRARMAIVSTLTSAEWESIKDAFGQGCAYCGCSDNHLTRDHVVPLAQGGHHTAENVVPACISCNMAKRDRTPEQWIREDAA